LLASDHGHPHRTVRSPILLGCGTLIADSSGFCTNFSPDAGGGPYSLDNMGSFVEGDYVEVSGTLITIFGTICWDPVGLIQGTVITACNPTVPFAECGELVSSAAGCILLEDAVGNTYELDVVPTAAVGDFVFVEAALDDSCVSTCGATGGCLTNVVYSSCETEFLRGDANNDSAVDISDAVFVLSSLFVPGSDSPQCDDAADVNDDGTKDISDAVSVLAALFTGGTIPVPDGFCGVDPTVDSLDCASSTCP